MKKRILILVIISFSILCLPVMPVMAEERTTQDGGLTLNIPEGYTAYTHDEIAQTLYNDKQNATNFLFDIIDKLTNSSGDSLSDIAIGIFGKIVDASVAEKAADEAFSDNVQFLISNNLNKDQCYVYYVDNNVPELTDCSYNRIRDDLFGNGKGIKAFLKDLGWPCHPEDARIIEPQNGGIPYLEISGSDSEKSYRLTEFLHNGYEYRMFLVYQKGTEIPESTLLAYDGIINSASIATSPNVQEPGLKYQDILKQRVELTD